MVWRWFGEWKIGVAGVLLVGWVSRLLVCGSSSAMTVEGDVDVEGEVRSEKGWKNPYWRA